MKNREALNAKREALKAELNWNPCPQVTRRSIRQGILEI